MDIRQIEYFLKVAETLHFGHAAEELGIPRQPLSIQIKRLEEDLGFKLFERTTRTVKLTPAGRAFRIGAIEAMDSLEAAVAAARRAERGEEGSLTVIYDSMTGYALLPGCLERFREEHPEVAVRAVSIETTASGPMSEQLRRPEVTAALVCCREEDLRNVPHTLLRVTDLLVAVRDDDPLAEKDRLTPVDLAGSTLLNCTGIMASARQSLGDTFHNVDPQPRIIESTSALSALGRMACGEGLGMVINETTSLLPEGAVAIPLDTTTKLGIYLAWQKGAEDPIVQGFSNAVRATI